MKLSSWSKYFRELPFFQWRLSGFVDLTPSTLLSRFCSYILNRGWIDKSQKKSAAYQEIVREDDELDNLEKSEDELDAAEEFESKYNFRFEDA